LKLTPSKANARKLAQRLISEIAKPRTWRDVAGDYPPIVKAGTLNRIAKSNGKWIPARMDLLIALGLKKETKPKPRRKLLPGEKQAREKIAVMHSETKRELAKHGIE